MLYAIAAAIALIADQALKYWVTANIELNGGFKPLIPGVIRLSNIHNSGAAFSFLQGARWLFVVLCVLFVAAVIWLLVKRIIATPGARWAAVFIMAGALGNCVDRILSGYVVDMLEFEFVRFPVFNLADIFITVGAIVFCIFLLVEKPVAADGRAAAADAQEPSAEPRQKKAKKSGYVHTPYVAPEPAPRRPEPPPIDPGDPFAEWELKSAETPPAAPARSAVPAQPAPPAQSAAPAQPAAAPELTESFDLDDILAEFKDWQ